MQKNPLYILAEITVDSTTIDLGALNESELESLTADLQELIYDLNRWGVSE